MSRIVAGFIIIALLCGMMTTNQLEAQEMTKEQNESKTLRLLFPQWQGGNNPPYSLGAKLLAWLAPESNALLVEVPVNPDDGKELAKENGVVAQSILLKQLKAARNIIDIYEPERVVVFGGDCHISQSAFAYLNERYEGELGILWIDAHPDVSTPEMFQHEHAMVLGNLLGHGDPKFAAEVKVPIKPENVIYAGLLIDQMNEKEAKEVERLDLKCVGPKELAENSNVIMQWIKDRKIKKLAIHLDLDVLDPQEFRSLLPMNPHGDQKYISGLVLGEMSMKQVARLIADVSKATDVVGLGIAEHLPWDAINLKKMLEQFPILK